MLWYDGAMGTVNVCNFCMFFGYSTSHCLNFDGTMESDYIALFSFLFLCGCCIVYCTNLLQTLLSFWNCTNLFENLFLYQLLL